MKNLLRQYKEIVLEQTAINSGYKYEIMDFMSKLDAKTTDISLKILNKENVSAYDIQDSSMIYFYPKNDGISGDPHEFCKLTKKGTDRYVIIDNKKNYSQITNLDEILMKMIQVIDLALDNNILIASYSLMLKLEDGIKPNYVGKASLVIPITAILTSDKVDSINFRETQKHFINTFLDHFMGWNFGANITRNEELKEALEKLNNKVIDKYLREDYSIRTKCEDVLDENPEYFYQLPITKKEKELN